MTTDIEKAIAVAKDVEAESSPLPWTRAPLTYWDDRGKNENHNWNSIDGAETSEGYDKDSFGSDKSKPWGGPVRTEPKYIALPDAKLIVHLRNTNNLAMAVIEAGRQWHDAITEHERLVEEEPDVVNISSASYIRIMSAMSRHRDALNAWAEVVNKN